MRIEFDQAKSEKNRLDWDLSFELAADFDWAGASYTEDVRNPYPEHWFVVVGYLGDRLHVLCFTPVPGGVRIISLRKANDRETKRYGKASTSD